MTTAPGAPCPHMDRFGCRQSHPVGLRIVSATGSGSIRGGGRGSTMLPGDLRHSTTAGGRTLAAIGDGYRDRVTYVQYGHRHWWPGSAVRTGVSRSDSAEALAGARSGMGNRSSPGTAWDEVTSAM